MQDGTGLIIDATRKASRFLQRDYFELENLQSSDKGTTSFCQKSCGKALQILCEALGKYYKTVIFDNEEAEKTNFIGKAALVETLDGLNNFERALPFFAIMVTIISNKDGNIIAEKSVINFPALGEIYYAEKGRGAWLERHSSNFAGALRARVSGTNDIGGALISSSFSKIDVARKMSENIRLFESCTYALVLLICGKIDVLINESRLISSKGIQMFVEESGGSYHVQDGLLLASNFKLHEKIKQLL